jgi:hypothetical protein
LYVDVEALRPISLSARLRALAEARSPAACSLHQISPFPTFVLLLPPSHPSYNDAHAHICHPTQNVHREAPRPWPPLSLFLGATTSQAFAPSQSGFTKGYPRTSNMRTLSFLALVATAHAFTLPSFLGTPAERYVSSGWSRVEVAGWGKRGAFGNGSSDET